MGKGPRQCPRYLGSSGAPALSAPRTEIGGSLYARRKFGIKATFHGPRYEALSLVAGLGKWLLFFDPKSGIAKRGLFLRPRAQRTVPVAAAM